MFPFCHRFSRPGFGRITGTLFFIAISIASASMTPDISGVIFLSPGKKENKLEK